MSTVKYSYGKGTPKKTVFSKWMQEAKNLIMWRIWRAATVQQCDRRVQHDSEKRRYGDIYEGSGFLLHSIAFRDL